LGLSIGKSSKEKAMTLESEETKRVRFSIQSKFLFFIILSILTSLGTGLYFALDLFYEDKSAYVFEASMSKSEQISKSLTDYIQQQVTNAEALAQVSMNSASDEVLTNIVSRKKEIYEFLLFHKNDEGGLVVHKHIKSSGIKDSLEVLEYFNSRTKDFLTEFDDLHSKNLKISYHFDFKQMPFIELAFASDSGREIYMLKVDAVPITNQFNSTSFESLLLDHNGSFLLAQNPKLATKDLASFIAGQQVAQGVFDVNLPTGKYLMGFHKINNLKVVIVSLINQNSAFQVARSLIQKSTAVAVFIISIALIVGVFFSHSITSPVDELMIGTAKVASGDFDSKVMVKTSDELSVLADSFNYMSDEIKRYMDEVKDKVRMEEELAVAQLVQASFFPHQNIIFENFSISGHYQSATECGGDWWGAFDIGGRKVFLIGDATGHGVPAALVTATANCCAQLLKDLSVGRPDLLDDPASILSMMNRVIFHMGGKILMTFFVGVYNESTSQLIYSNASHNSPLMYRFTDAEPSKENLSVLMEAVGNRLGHKLDSTYENAQISFSKNDVLLLFTDGIVEAENSEGKQFGDRRFLKSFLKVAKTSPEEIISQILKDAYDYYQDVPPNDDITLVAVKQG
jgi:sigma-B regulation protein RsbU (phosphoserine phosphatase)